MPVANYLGQVFWNTAKVTRPAKTKLTFKEMAHASVPDDRDNALTWRIFYKH